MEKEKRVVRFNNKVVLTYYTPKPLQPGTFLTPGQLMVTGITGTSHSHSAAYNINYKLRSAHSKIGGTWLPNGFRACNMELVDTAAIDQCLAGYFAGWSSYRRTSKYGSNS
jgi:hypothetical protein